MPGAQRQNFDPNPLDWPDEVTAGAERGVEAGISSLSAPLTKGVGEVEGFTSARIDNFLNTMWFFIVACVGAFLMFKGMNIIMGNYGSATQVITSLGGLRG
jgi:hypothetical protein